MKNLHPDCRVISGVDVQKRTDESAREQVRLGTVCSRFYDFGRNKMEILKIMHLPMNFGYAQRE